MKINDKIFSLPPYLSTSWNNVAAIYMRETTLIVNMIDGESVDIPDLSPDLLETIFNSHAIYLEDNSNAEEAANREFGTLPFQQMQDESGELPLPLKFGIGAMDTWGAALQHNPSQSNMPNLPDEVLEKVRSISKIISPEDPMAMPKPEPHCNCMHCQIARAINQGLGVNDMYEKEEASKQENEEQVADVDLSFQQWEIQQTEDKLYTVVNRLDTDEKYNVYLGHPVGCTCGKQGCEHILAVLKS
jgi:hypothetical protein